MKLTQKQWEELCAKTGIKDTATSADEEQRKRDINMKILLALWTSEDRVWLANHKEKLKQEKLAQKLKQKAIKQREAARKKKTPSRPVPPEPFGFGNGPARPLRFDSEKPS